MTVEVRPLGDRCNIACKYCYQETMRESGLLPVSYDMEAMLAQLEAAGEPFVLFGGEALMMKDADLEILLRYGAERYGEVGIQTNGTLVRDRHIEMFKRYGVRIGLSLDGPGALNDARWAGSVERTRRATARVEALVERLCFAGAHPAMIITLNRHNAGAERLSELTQWLRYLDARGITRARIHPLQSGPSTASQGLLLSSDETLAAMRAFRMLEKSLPALRFDLFEEMESLLLGEDQNASCVWYACDAYATRGVQGVEGTGISSNCGRIQTDGVAYTVADRRGFERQVSLYRTPQPQGGCFGCRFFLMCKGQCPGTGLGGDWRLRSEHCSVWKGLFEDMELDLLDQGREPLSLSADRDLMESELFANLERGVDESLGSLVRRLSVSLN